MEVIGISSGFLGLINQEYVHLDENQLSGILILGGTILGTSRENPFKKNAIFNSIDKPKLIKKHYDELGLDALVCIGGNGTQLTASLLADEGLNIIGIPKTIDNDVTQTDFSIGFQTAVQIATDALDRLRSTAESHHRVMVLEVMGRDAGWIATYSGLANGADEILIPEVPVTEERLASMCDKLIKRRNRGIVFSIIVAAEGAKLLGQNITQEKPAGEDSPAPRLGGVGQQLGEIIEQRTGIETRVSTLGYIQRGGTPVSYDRTLATAFGVKATNLIKNKKFGEMTALKGVRIVGVPLEKVSDGIKTVDLRAYAVASKFFA